MNWYYQVILVFVSINMFAWWGAHILPTTSPIYTNLTEVSSVPRRVLGTWFDVDVEPGTMGWLESNESSFNSSVTTEGSEVPDITSNPVGYLTSGSVIGYISGFLSNISSFFGATSALLYGMGMPWAYAAMINVLYNLLFLFALIALITGRGS